MPRPDQWSPVRNDPPPPAIDVGSELRYSPGTEVRSHDPNEGQPAWRINKRFSKEYKVPDEAGQEQIVRLFTIGAVASALSKMPVTIRRWIQLGYLPDSGLRTQSIVGTLGDAGRRLWTEEQLLAMIRIGVEEGVTAASPSTTAMQRFASRIRVLWQQNNW